MKEWRSLARQLPRLMLIVGKGEFAALLSLRALEKGEAISLTMNNYLSEGDCFGSLAMTATLMGYSQ